MNVVFNTRKSIGISPTYFGNAACVKSVPTTTHQEDLTLRALKVMGIGGERRREEEEEEEEE